MALLAGKTHLGWAYSGLRMGFNGTVCLIDFIGNPLSEPAVAALGEGFR